MGEGRLHPSLSLEAAGPVLLWKTPKVQGRSAFSHFGCDLAVGCCWQGPDVGSWAPKCLRPGACPLWADVCHSTRLTRPLSPGLPGAEAALCFVARHSQDLGGGPSTLPGIQVPCSSGPLATALPQHSREA